MSISIPQSLKSLLRTVLGYTQSVPNLKTVDEAPTSTSEIVGPSSADMIHELVGDQKNTRQTQSLAQPELNNLQMTWEADVEDAYPVALPAVFFLMKEFPNPHKRVYITSLADTETVVAAIRATLGCWSIMRSIAVEYDEKTRLLVVLRGTEQYFHQAISVRPDVENEQALTKTSISGNHAASELPRGLLLRVVVARVKNTGTVGVVILINHAIFDATSIKAWEKDLETFLQKETVPSKTPYKVFSEMYFLHQTSLAARLAIEYHVRRLRGIGSMQQAIWLPPQLFHNVSTRAGVPNNEGKMEAIEGGGENNMQIIRYRRCHNIAAIGRKPSTLTMAAIASLNTFLTGSSRAIFGLLLAGREWPFMNNSVARLLPSPYSVAGPTVSSTLIVVDVNDAEQVSPFLARLEEELRILRRHQHVPLDFAAHLGEEDRAVFLNARRQFLNFIPNSWGAQGRTLDGSLLRLISEEEYKVDSTINAFHWQCFLQDAETLCIRAMFHPDMFSEQQVERFVESVLDLVDFISDANNLGKEVREMRSLLSKRFSEI